jgi:hypothetical protein
MEHGQFKMYMKWESIFKYSYHYDSCGCGFGVVFIVTFVR